MQEQNYKEPISSKIFKRKCQLQIQYKQHVQAIEQAQVELQNDVLNLLVHEKACDLKIRISYAHMLSVAKNTKDSKLFKLIIFVNDGNGDAEQYEEEEDEEEEEEQQLSGEMQIIKNLEQLKSGNHQYIGNNTTINLSGCFTVTVSFPLLGVQPSNQKKDLLSQLERHVEMSDKKNLLYIDCEQLYEKIVHHLNQLEDSKKGENSNQGISNLLMGQQIQGEDEEWEDQQGEMDWEMEGCQQNKGNSQE